MKRTTLVIPGEPQVKQRPRLARAGNVYTPRETVQYELEVAWAARASKIKFGASLVGCRITCFFGKRRKGDIDNFCKSLLDGFQKGGLIEDDFNVIHLTGKVKHDADNPRVEVKMWEIAEPVI